MKRFFFALILSFVATVTAKNVDTSLEESLALRRIAEYWKEKDYGTAKLKIKEFLSQNAASPYTDQLYAMLGDLNFQEKNFQEAVASYDKIASEEFRHKCRFRHLHALYETGKQEEFILAADHFLKDPRAEDDQLNTIRFELAETYFLKAHALENESKKKDWLKSALSEYQQLMHTKYSDMTLLPQAQIYAFLEDYPKAASLYQLLAHKNSSKREEYLFQAASLQLHTDKKAAIDSFAAIVELEGKYASKAAFNQLNLLFQEKRYRDFILAHDKASKFIPSEKKPIIQYFLGKSFFHTPDFNRAIDPLKQSLATKCLDRAQEKSALLSLVICAKETKDFALFEKVLFHLKTEFASDEETDKTQLMYVEFCRERKEWAKARFTLKELLEFSPYHQQREALMYDYALLLVQEEKWAEAAIAFETFRVEFPQSSNHANAVRQVVSCRLEDVKHATAETERIKKDELLSSLNSIENDRQAFTAPEKQKIRYLRGKTEFELGLYDEAIEDFGNYVRDFPKDTACADAYLLIAYAYQKGSHDDMHFVLNAERALALNPQLQGALDLHLTLYNTYLSLAEKASVTEKALMLEKGADHLYTALDKPISKENQRWLSSYYFQQYQKGRGASLERAAIVLEKLLSVNAQSFDLSIDPQSLDQEGEAIKLAEIYAKTGRMKARAKLLEALSKEQQTHPSYPWKYQRMTTFELGRTYLALGERERSLQTFEELISNSSHANSYFATAAELEAIKLKYSMLSETQRQEDSEAILAICDALKDIQLKRKLHSEPVHLEAALCYVDIKSDLAPQHQKNSHKRFLLTQMKENFSCEDDPLVRQYFSAAAQFPDKQQLFQHYLTLVDVTVRLLEAEETQNNDALKVAKNALDQLMAETTDETLKQRISQMQTSGEQEL